MRPVLQDRYVPFVYLLVVEPHPAGGGAGPRMRILILFFCTGLSAIAAEVAWLRLFQPALGSTVETTAVVIALYLAGLAGGALLFGRWVPRIQDPGRGFLLLLGFGGAVLALSPILLHPLGGGTTLHLGLATALLVSSAILLGGTWPLLAEAVPPGQAGRGLGSLSLVHNLGGAAGGLLAGFVLLPRIGVAGALHAAGGLLLVTAVAGFILLSGSGGRQSGDPGLTPGIGPRRRWVWAVAYGVAGLVFVGVEVSWTRLFSLFFQNSVYTFSAILAVYLAGTAVGAFLAAGIADRVDRPGRLAGMVLALASGLALIPPLLFAPLIGLQEWVREWPGFDSHGAALLADIVLSGIAFLPGTVAMGFLFPLVGRLLGEGRSALGRPAAIAFGVGTIGSIFGGPVAGFLLIPHVGVIRALEILGAVGLAAGAFGLLCGEAGDRRGSLWKVAPLLGLFLVAAFGLEALPGPGKVALRPGERLLEEREGRAAYAAVVEDVEGNRRLKVNRSYSMGGDLGVRVERRQGLLPVTLHPGPARALVIGLGTGVTLGAVASDPEVEVVCVEILPEVIDLSDHFRGDHGDVLANSRVRLVETDGRAFLRNSGETWDLIVSDLFFPWRPGVGPLYAVEHFETARGKLREGGVYWQWFALHQLTLEEVRCLCRTFASVFPEVEIWMAGLSAEVPVAALVGSDRPLPWRGIEGGIDRMGTPRLEAAGLGADVDLLALRVASTRGVRAFSEGARIHTDDRPTIEFTSPPNFFEEPLSILRPNLVALAELLEAPGPPGPEPLGALREAAAWCLRGEIARIDREPVPEMQAHFRALAVMPELRRPRQAILYRARKFISVSKPKSARRILDTFLEAFPDDPEAVRLRDEARGKGRPDPVR